MMQRVWKPVARPVERRNPQSIVGMGEEELTVWVGREYMPVRGDDGVIEVRSRAGMPASAAVMPWPVEIAQEAEDQFVQSWSAVDFHRLCEKNRTLVVHSWRPHWQHSGKGGICGSSKGLT